MDELVATGRHLNPTEFNAIIFRNIGPEYHGIITALNLKAEHVSFNELHNQLISHELLLKTNFETYMANLAYKPPILPTPTASIVAPPSSPYGGPSGSPSMAV